MIRASLLLLLASTTLYAGPTRGVETPFKARRRGKLVEKTKPGEQQVLFGRSRQKSSIAFDRTAEGLHRRIDASFRIKMQGQNEGLCFALLHTGRFHAKGMMWNPQPTRKTSPEQLATPDWQEPNLIDTFAVGFDVKNVRDEDWFNENGNYDGRPEREVSLHYDGRELFNVLCPEELATGKWVDVAVSVAFVTGGADVSVTVGGKKAYDRQFVPHLQPYESRVGFGGHGTGEAWIDKIEVAYGEPMAAPLPAPITVQAFRGAWLKQKKARLQQEVALLEAATERIILTVTYRGPMARDYWDRNSAVYAFADDGTRFEIARITTPFMVWKKRYRYDIDVSDFAPLLFGKRKLGLMAGSNVAQGFLMDVALTYYRGAAPKAMQVVNVWSGNAHFNKPGHVAKFFAPKSIPVPDGATRARVRVVVSGHGVMEFTALPRTLTVNGTEHKDGLARTDCYLNPYRRQFGTWKFDRGGGWAPGAVVRPWIVDVGKLGKTIELAYAPDAFTAKKWANHWVEAQVVFYR